MAVMHDFFEKYTFLCEMYEEEADKIITLILNFFPFDNSIQVIDSKKGKNLVRRTQTTHVTQEMLQIGNIINVFSKLLYIKDCAPATHNILFKNSERTFVLIKPCKPELHGKIINYIMNKGFRIVNLKNAKLTKDMALELYKHHSGKTIMPIVIDYVTSGEAVGMELVGPNAVERFRKCLGASDPRDAAPGTLRRLFGENLIRNTAHACDSVEEAAEMIEFFFGYDHGEPRVPFRATYRDCTCCIIKPHVIIDGNFGAVLEHISTSGKFYISCMGMFTVPLVCAEEFYEVYKHVLPEYDDMCFFLAAGKCIALEVKSVDPSVEVVSEFRKLCGPMDPDMCRVLYPDTIRALYGKDAISNAVHCTDLPEDGVTEVEYMFKLLAHHIFSF